MSVGGNEARVRVKHSAHLKRKSYVTKFKMSSHVMNECRIFIQVIFALCSKSRESSQWLGPCRQAAWSQYLEEHLMNPSGDEI